MKLKGRLRGWRRKEILFAFFLLCFLTVLTLPAAAGKGEIPLMPLGGKTDEKGVPLGWKELTFKENPEHTKYTVVKDGEEWVIKAQSRRSASGLTRELEVDPQKFPIIKWRWKIKNTLPVSDERKKEGDDYAARVCVTFKFLPQTASAAEKAMYDAGKIYYGKYPPKGSLNYIWANKTAKGQVFNSPYIDRSKMVVVESGNTLAGKWVEEERNIYEDYVKCFGHQPPPISGIVIMTDSDNSKGETEAYYGGMVLKGKE